MRGLIKAVAVLLGINYLAKKIMEPIYVLKIRKILNDDEKKH